MDTAVAAEAIAKTFPNGAVVMDEGMGLHYPIVDLQVEDQDGTPTLLGWGVPNKDFYYNLGAVQERPDGWVVTRDGHRCLLMPQTPEDEARVKLTMGYLN